MPRRTPRFAILAEGAFGAETAKTAASAIRYLPGRVSSVLDSRHAGRPVREILGHGGDIPVLATLAEAQGTDPPPEALLIGIAPQGGRLPPAWRRLVEEALAAGLDVWSGLHAHLSDDPDLVRLARSHGAALVDLRKPPSDLPVGTGRARSTTAFRVLTVGADSNAGKMTTALEVRRGLEERGVPTGFAATGQTGILIEGRGIAVDAVVSDFIAGAAERVTLEAAEGARVVLVEGQGSLMHPAYSGVTLGLLHGSLPQAMILCAVPDRPTIYGGNHDWVELPPLDEVVRRYEAAASWVRPDPPARVAGISLATYRMPEAAARAAVEGAAALTGLPATDPIRFGAGPLVEAVLDRLPAPADAAGR